MRFEPSFRNLSLTTKLISSYLVILGIGGLATSFLGSWIVSSTIMRQARGTVVHDLATAHMVYQQQLNNIHQAITLAARGETIPSLLSQGDAESLQSFLRWVQERARLDFLTLTDRSGKVIFRKPAASPDQNELKPPNFVEEALHGTSRASTEIVSAEFLKQESEALNEQARILLRATSHARESPQTLQTSGMVMIASAPVRRDGEEVFGALYGGVLLNQNLEFVDQLWEVLYRGEQFEGKNIGTVTVFLDDIRISTNVTTDSGERAIGTRASEEVYETVIGQGLHWTDRAFVVNDWYISAYEPIRNHGQQVIGMLYVGLLERSFTSVINRVIATFFFIATVGFILIIIVTYFMIRSITRPVAEMVLATQQISSGRLNLEVSSTSGDEIGQLAQSFNSMLKSLQQMKADLEEWGQTLETKVEERTAELVTMQARVAQSDRLASLGKLAAGVAHEINNPLGGILSLTSLALEDLPQDDPNRENLEEVINQTRRCRDIVMGLLEFSRESELRSEPVDLNRIIQNILSVIEKQAMFFNIEVIKSWDPKLPQVLADESQLQQVFMNIIINAVQAMEELGTLTIETHFDEQNGLSEVRIRDTGIGIPANKVNRIFDPFYTTKPSGQGTGLGLSIAYGIVTRHGGMISVESTSGEGSTFRVQLPAIAKRESEARQ